MKRLKFCLWFDNTGIYHIVYKQKRQPLIAFWTSGKKRKNYSYKIGPMVFTVTIAIQAKIKNVGAGFYSEVGLLFLNLWKIEMSLQMSEVDCCGNYASRGFGRDSAQNERRRKARMDKQIKGLLYRMIERKVINRVTAPLENRN